MVDILKSTNQGNDDMLEAINLEVAVQGKAYKIKSDTIAPAKVSKIADQNVRPDRKIKED